jgi:aldose 1-epimerase
MIKLKNHYITISILEDCGMTISQIYYQNVSILYFPFTEEEYKNNQELAGIPFLYPFANRLSKKEFLLEKKFLRIPDNAYFDPNGLPIHGFLLKSKWNILKLTENTLIASINFADKDFYHLFPFKHQIEYKIEIWENQIHFYITILPEEPLPISFGFHPYFLLYDKKSNIQLILPVKKQIHTDKQLIPTGNFIPIEEFLKNNHITYTKSDGGYQININHFFDHGFIDFFDDKNFNVIQLIQPKYHLKLSMDRSFKVCQIYSPLEKNFICIEPMITQTNAFIQGNYLVINQETSFHYYLEIN